MSGKRRLPSCNASLTRRDVLRAGPLLFVSAQTTLTQRQQDCRASTPASSNSEPDIVIENADFRLAIAGDGTARSLIEKTSDQECLVAGEKLPAFSITQYSPLDIGQLGLLYPADAKTFGARMVRRDGDLLQVAFAGVPYEVAIRLKVARHYVAFTVEQVRMEGKAWEDFEGVKSPIEEMVLLQLPLRERANFGSWLNVMWDDEVAVNLLAADPWCHISSDARCGYRLVRASTEDRVKTTGVKAVLIAAPTQMLIDRLAEVENDFGLPRGAESRRRKEYKYSYYWAEGVTPETIDMQIEYAHRGGFRAIMVSYTDFAKTAGHFPWRAEYPGGMDDLRGVVQKIKKAGIIPGLHFHYCKAEKADPYVSGRPDGRLNVTRFFTLAAPLDTMSATITVYENPSGATLDDDRRLLRIGSELVTYEKYTTTSPYQFTGCRRAQLGTQPGAYEAGIMFGLLDVDTWPIFIRFNQNTTIQQEVALRIAALYKAGFEFVYFDGAEDVHPPFWFTTAWAQWVVYQLLTPAPLFAEGAQRAHFNWHILSRSNAYDPATPDKMKASLRRYQEVQAPLTAKDFTAINFGWMRYRAPDARSVGTQPDMVEYVVSRAAGWDCPYSLLAQVPVLQAHARTPDNLEVMRRWQEATIRNSLSGSQKELLRSSEREHILLINESGDYELLPYEEIPGVARPDRPVSAFVFERAGKNWVVYWHQTGRAVLEVPLRAPSLRLWDEPGRKALPLKQTDTGILLPAEGRRYLECPGFSKSAIASAFQEGRFSC